MILWNTSGSELETQYDGIFYMFAPNQQKFFHELLLTEHLMIKLAQYGLVKSLKDQMTPEEERKLLLEGLKARWRNLDRVGRNFIAMNKQRESNKESAALMSDAEADCIVEAKKIRTRIEELEKEKFDAVKEYLNDPKIKAASDALKESDETPIATGLGVETKSAGRPRKAVA